MLTVFVLWHVDPALVLGECHFMSAFLTAAVKVTVLSCSPCFFCTQPSLGWPSSLPSPPYLSTRPLCISTAEMADSGGARRCHH